MEMIEQELERPEPIAFKVALLIAKVSLTLSVLVFGYFVIYDPDGGVNLCKNFSDWVIENPGKFATIVIIKIFMGMFKLAMIECCFRGCHKYRKSKKR